MTLDQAIHAAMALGALLVAVVGFLAREQLSDVKQGVRDMHAKFDGLTGTVAHHGERLAGLEAQSGRPIPHVAPTNGRSRG